MSRCLAFPPPGYLWNGVGGEDLIELIIKLKRKRRRAKKERKKERRRQKKEMAKAEGNGEINQPRRNIYKRVDNDGSIIVWEKYDLQQERFYQTRGLENCSLMKDLGQPMIFKSRCDSSDNYHNIKRKRPISPPKGCQSRGEYFPHHNRMRCLLQKHKDSEVLFSKPPLFCTPTRMNFVVQESLGMVLRPIEEYSCSGYIMSRTAAREMEPRAGNELCHSTSGRTENHENASTSSLSESDSLQIESQLRELILDWIPSPMQSMRTEFDDQDWLFDTRLPGSQATKSSNGCTADSCPENPTQFPFIHSVGEPKTYAFPYELPF